MLLVDHMMPGDVACGQGIFPLPGSGSLKRPGRAGIPPTTTGGADREHVAFLQREARLAGEWGNRAVHLEDAVEGVRARTGTPLRIRGRDAPVGEERALAGGEGLQLPDDAVTAAVAS